MAATPVVDRPPTIVIVGADKYPLPGVCKIILFTTPLVKNALAVAPEPLSLEIITVGSVI